MTLTGSLVYIHKNDIYTQYGDEMRGRGGNEKLVEQEFKGANVSIENGLLTLDK